MKTFFRSISAIFLISLCFFLIISSACNKDEDDNNNNGSIFWNENWLIGTWEATTPANTDPLFNNKKIRLVLNQVALKVHDTVPHNIVNTWVYSGTLTYDLDAIAPWGMRFYHAEYPKGINSFGWQSATMYQANVTINNISLRIGDSVNMQPSAEYDFDLDWGPYNDYSRAVPTYLDFYGDIEIYVNGTNHRDEYPPTAGQMLRFTKK
jgi:hypothetical protein